MPSRSISPSTVEETSVKVMPRAAAMLAMPAVRQAARACSTYSTGVGPLSVPTSTGGWSASNVNGSRWVISCLAPWKPWMAERLWVPLIQVLVARKRNFAMSGSPFTASSVANRVAVSTPLRTGFSAMVMISPLVVAPGDRFGSVRFAVRGRRHIGTGHGSTDIGDHYRWPTGRDGGRRTTLGDVTTAGAAKNAEVTAREAEVLALIARHLTNAQIAEALFISRRTVETHVSALLRKLQLPDRRSLARHAEVMPDLLVKSGQRGLPLPVTSFIGRAGERTVLAAALAEHRMVTATGPGGIGKTRLALSVAAELAPARREGEWFVDLIHVTDPATVTAAVAETVGLPRQRTTAADRGPVAPLAASDALLVIDNCEHVLDGVRPCVERIIAGCPEVTVLATSRTRLLLPCERVYVVPGLSVIGRGGDAVDLFAARVTAATGDPTPPDPVRVAALCRALDGMALAIELAAARFAALGLDGLEAGLDQRLRLLTAGPRAADRHASLRAAIGWSYDLLSSGDRALLRRAALFASWFDVDAARAVAGAGRERAEIADGLARLAEHSLLVVERGERTRYRVLETIRQYGVERLDEAGELDQIRAGHERWCRRALAALGQTGTADIDDAWCARFDRIVDDASGAFAWSAGQESRQAQAAELAAELASLLFLRGRPAQAQRRYEQGAELAATATERVALLRLAAGTAASRFAGDDALRLFRIAADAAVTAGDRTGAARDLATMAMYINRAP